MSADFTVGHVEEIIAELEMAVRAARDSDNSNRIVKQLERMKKHWRVRLQRLLALKKKNDFLAWESLGVDQLFVDEAHLHKNLWRHTKMTRIAGLPLANSQRAFDLYLKTRYTMGLYRGRQRGVVLATATPVANTVAEIHTFQRYLQPATLVELGLEQFDAWAATFGESVTALEIAPDGSGYRMHTRFARFINVPELMTIFGEIADIQTKEMLKLPVPRIKGGKPRTVTCRPSAGLKAYVQALVKRAERIRNREVDPARDNMLLVTTDGRKAALDLRLAIPAALGDEESKVMKCAHEVHEIWQHTAGFNGVQLVFCDLSAPKGGKAFSVYDALRDELIRRGIPDGQVAFIHDADTDARKAALFRKVRAGAVRVLLGSTSKMGVGTNVQKRLYALHELDCPWRPCDIEQREGRIERQGDECEEIEIVRYVTESSFDAYSWQTVLAKAKFITQVMSGDRGLRTIEDVELATLSYAEVRALASGNPKVIEKAGVDADVARYSASFSVWRNQRYANESEVANLPLQIGAVEKLLDNLVVDAATAREVLQAPGGLVATVRGAVCRGAEPIGEALRAIDRANRAVPVLRDAEELVGKVGGFELFAAVAREVDNNAFVLRGRLHHACQPYRTAPALHHALVDALNGIEQRRQDTQARLTRLRQRLVDLREELERPFEHEERLLSLMTRQRELARELDLDRDEAGTQALDAPDDSQAA